MTVLEASPKAVAEVAIEALEAQICELAAHLDAARGRFLVMLGNFDAREGWAGTGTMSCAHWLAWRCGYGLQAAREHVRVARALRGLPVIRAALCSGELSYAKVRALSRVARPDTEADMAELAKATTASQLERLVRCYRRAIPAEDEAQAERASFERRYLDTYTEEDGSVVLRARLSPGQGAVVLGALSAAIGDEARSHSRDDSAESSVAEAEPVPDEVGGASQRRADALVAIAEGFLAASRATRSGLAAECHEVVIHVDAALLDDSEASGRCHGQEGPALGMEAVRRFACDGHVRVVSHGPNGTPMDVGRRTRAVPLRLHRALSIRDQQRCRFPGCSARIVDAHHVWHWTAGGPTDLSNLALLCRRHHTLVHEGGWSFDYDPADDSVSVRHPNGFPMATSPPSTPVDGDIEAQNSSAGADIDAYTCVSDGAGERMDYSMAVEGWLVLNGYPIE